MVSGNATIPKAIKESYAVTVAANVITIYLLDVVRNAS